MSRRTIRRASILLSAMLVSGGCSSTVDVPDAQSPAYDRWASFSPGSWVKHWRVRESAGIRTEETIHTIVLSVHENAVRLEIRKTRDLGAGPKAAPPREISIPRSRNSRTDESTAAEAREIVAIARRTLDCRRVDIVRRKLDTTEKTRIWFSERVPGGFVKSESATDGIVQSRSRTELIDFKVSN